MYNCTQNVQDRPPTPYEKYSPSRCDDWRLGEYENESKWYGNEGEVGRAIRVKPKKNPLQNELQKLFMKIESIDVNHTHRN